MTEITKGEQRLIKWSNVNNGIKGTIEIEGLFHTKSSCRQQKIKKLKKINSTHMNDLSKGFPTITMESHLSGTSI